MNFRISIIETEPTGAEVYVNFFYAGETPLECELSPGDVVTIEKKDRLKITWKYKGGDTLSFDMKEDRAYLKDRSGKASLVGLDISEPDNRKFFLGATESLKDIRFIHLEYIDDEVVRRLLELPEFSALSFSGRRQVPFILSRGFPSSKSWTSPEAT